MSRRPVLPPGRCLTDIWPHLTPSQRLPWLRIVEAEARQVRDDVRLARQGVRVTAEQRQRRDAVLAALYRSRKVNAPSPSE